jgi:membrane protein implicated in regulation of membrane protease activity
MQWWAWFAVGAILLGSELAFVNAQFYLVFIGAAALVVGFLGLAGVSAAAWLQWLLFTALAAASMVGFRRRIYERIRRNMPVMRVSPAGESLTLTAALPPGQTCRIEYRGTWWSAINGGDSVIAAGARARIARIDGLTLVVHAER